MKDEIKYFIYSEGEPLEVTETTYENWCDTVRDQYVLPEYVASIGENNYYLECIYDGEMDRSRYTNPLPFMLRYFEDVPEITGTGIKYVEKNINEEFFRTFEEMEDRRKEMMEEIEARSAV